VGFCVLSILNSFTLPKVPPAGPGGPDERLPTAEALARLLSPEARFLCLGLALAYMGTIAYYTFIPIYFQQVIGIDPSYIGLIINLGVVIEIFFTLGMPALQRRLGLKGIIVIGLAGTTLRMFLLAVSPTVWTAILIQVVHGMEVLAIFVAPVMFIDRLAGDRFRNSIQGVFTMTVGGGARIIGGLLAGWVAAANLRGFLFYASALTLTAMLIILFRFRPIPDPKKDSSSNLRSP
jgi:MFS family permease